MTSHEVIFLPKIPPDQLALFRIFYQKYNGILYAHVRNIAPRFPDLQEDILQEAWIGLLPYLSQIAEKTEQKALAYLLTAVDHTAERLIKNESIVQKPIVSFEELKKDVSSGPDDLLDEICASESARQIAQTILSLPEDLQAVLYLHYICVMCPAEIAKHLHLSRWSVYKRLQRGKSLLIQKLQEEGSAVVHEKK
jgi:RNA polymerase sigma-70 factor (ECF subfamily)